MRRALLALAAALAIAPALKADAPKASVKGPASVAPGGTIVLDARSSVADRPLRWKLDGPDVPFLTLDQDGRKGVVALVPSAPAGTYRFTLIARGVPPGEVEIDADAALFVVVVEAPAPPAPAPKPRPDPPAPKPDPAPTPPAPAPVSGTLNVSLVVDLDAMTPDLAVVRQGTKARDAFKALDAVYRTYAGTSPDLARLNMTATVQRAGTPCLIVQDAAGRVIAAEKAPASEDDLIARVKALREGK